MDQYDGTKYYHRIPGLLVPRAGKSYERMNKDINRYIDTMPELVNKIEDDLAKIDISGQQSDLLKNLELLRTLLHEVYAFGLEAYTARLIRHINDNAIAQSQKLLHSFTTDLLLLSVAMQRAQILNNKEVAESVCKIEFHANMAKSLSAVKALISDCDHNNANKMTKELVVYNPMEDSLVKLLEMITAKRYDEAEQYADILEEQHIEAITRLAGTDLSKTILAVDDMPEILSFVNNALKMHYRVIAVPSGKAALKVLETQKPDLFILDIDMPVMDGFELAKTIRGCAGYAATPLIFLTGNASRNHITVAISVGCDDFIVKPATHEYLLTKVGKYLNADG